ncbi:hypothetical protein G4O51_10405 [Candidatus Bathyarchaeota archaeon A05DMB-2]|jgi:hypothetical protein|nr:hypothetical protein [Candidatus Bathyarchaeota archaeon A05DMB-2]
MNARRTLTKIVGVTQTAIGGIAVIFAFLFFYNVFGIHSMIGVTKNGVGFYLWIFIIFGLLSLISGLFLYYEES